MCALPIFPGERADCRRWRKEGGERVAAVGERGSRFSGNESTGHRNRSVARQVLSAQMSLTSVFGLVASPTAASGGSREGAASAAVGKKRACYVRQSFCRAPQTETGGPSSQSTRTIYNKKPHHFRSEVSVFALPIFLGRPSIVMPWRQSGGLLQA